MIRTRTKRLHIDDEEVEILNETWKPILLHKSLKYIDLI
jgi:hypothetical protein